MTRPQVRPGRRYRLRNGETVGHIKPRLIDGKFAFWVGENERRGGTMTWQADGYYAPEVGVRPHPWDIVGLAKGSGN
jgi:hypothetical protein